ncbi:MAG: hypothetical protein K0U63_11550 [Cyanobacteria bacterium]|jgi:ribonucleotide monophosphatase NagD (HAD superfamily)|nr:hypothetical protein [Cyanobacteriota bacterium]
MNARSQALLLDVQGVLVDNGLALAGALDTVREARQRFPEHLQPSIGGR